MNKIELIKSIRTATNCSLEQAKPLANFIWELQERQEKLEAGKMNETCRWCGKKFDPKASEHKNLCGNRCFHEENACQ